MFESNEPKLSYDIDWSMLDKTRFIPLNLLSTFIVRSLLYPVALARTRLQVQVKSSIYKGTWHTLRTTVRYEGFRSLYQGFVIHNCHLLPGLVYITTFEATRVQANVITKNEYLRAGIGGVLGSLCSQILACPIDVISQHMQLVGVTSSEKKMHSMPRKSSTKASSELHHRHVTRIHVPKRIRHSSYLIFKFICKELLYGIPSDRNLQTTGISLARFYRGYLISTFLFSLTSAIWWPSYYFYQKQMLICESSVFKQTHLSLLLIQCIAGPLSSLTATLLTNPIDICRTRIQVEQERRRIFSIMRELWHEERFHIFTKGLTARLSHSCIYSLLTVLAYESIKRISSKQEYKEYVRW